MIVKIRNIILMILAPALLILSRPGLAQEKVFKLDEVIITATKTEHTLGDVPITAQVITREEIEARNVKTVQDALKYLTGIKVDEAYTQGAEVSLACQILENLTGRAGYTFLDTEDKETNKELPHRAKNTIVAELDWKIPEIDLNLNLAGEYAGKRYDDAENTEKLGGYTVFDLALTKYIGEHIRIFARVDNIFKKKNVRDEYDIDGAEFLGGVEAKF